jgi:hypothetical protein
VHTRIRYNGYVSTVSVAGASVSLRPSGIGRYFGAAFLSVWLAGWLAGEVLALGFLFLIVRSVVGSAIGASWPVPGGGDWIAGGAAGVFFLFLLVWITFWTFGGIAAITELLRSLAGEDRISVQASGVELERRAGPCRRLRNFERSTIRRVRLRPHDQAVMMDTTAGTEVISKYGTLDDRQAMAEWLRSRLLLPEHRAHVDPTAAPAGWTMTIEGGATHLTRMDPRTRRISSSIMWAIVAFMALIVFGGADAGVTSAGRVVLPVLTALVTLGAAWITWSRREWVVRHGELAAHTTFLTWQRERSFKSSARLEVATSTDSDNDHHYTLTVKDAEGTRKIASNMNDDAEIVDLARWLSARTGLPLTLPRELQ